MQLQWNNNEQAVVLGQYFTHTTSMLEVEGTLRKIAARYKDGDGPEVHVPAMIHIISLSCKPANTEAAVHLHASAHLCVSSTGGRWIVRYPCNYVRL